MPEFRGRVGRYLGRGTAGHVRCIVLVEVHMSDGGWKIFSVRRIPIRLHWTFFLILPWLAFSMMRRFQAYAAWAHVDADQLLLSPFSWGVLLALLLFASVLLHELGHVFVARAQGSPVRDVTLMMLGGVSHIEKVSDKPRAEALMAVVGPLVSVGIALVAYVAHLLFTGAPDVRFGLYYLAQINLVIGVFNLLPAFPLDGGRVLRSVIEPRVGRVRATRVAANVGRIMAALMVLGGLLGGNLLLVAVAVFVWSAGGAEAERVAMRDRLRGVKVADVATFGVPMMFAEDSIAHAGELMLRSRREVLLARRRDGAIGVVSAREVAAVPPSLRTKQTVEAIVRFDAPFVDDAAPVDDALDAMGDGGELRLPVMRNGALVGVLDIESIVRFVQLHDESAPRPSLA